MAARGGWLTPPVGISLWHAWWLADWAHKKKFDGTVWSQLRCLVKERASLSAQDATPPLQEHRLSRVCHTG